MHVENSKTCSDFNKTDRIRIDPFDLLPTEIILEIFSNLNLSSLGMICLLNKKWNQLAKTPDLWKIIIYREFAFSNDKWAEYFGEEAVKDEDRAEEFSSFPFKEFIEDYRQFKTIFPNNEDNYAFKIIRLPKTLCGKLTLKSLGELTKKFFPDNEHGYRHIDPRVFEEYGDKPIKKSCWVVMTGLLPESRNKKYAEQQSIIADLAQKGLIGYQIPNLMQAAAFILANYIDSNKRIFGDNPWTYIVCKNKSRGCQCVIGGFDPDGFFISFNRGQQQDSKFGAAAIKKWNSSGSLE